MRIETKFDIGQVVRYKRAAKVSEECFLCEGEPRVEVNSMLYICPECYGDGVVDTVKWREVESKIVRVSAETCVKGEEMYKMENGGWRNADELEVVE